MEPTRLPIDVIWGVGCAVFCMVMGAVTMWWESRHRRKAEDEEE